MKWFGLLVLAGTAIHYGYHLYHHRPWDLLWACHVAAALVGIGCLLDWPPCVGIGLLWLMAGVPLWVLDLVTGGEMTPTSILTHLGGLAVGMSYVGVRGMSAGSWWQAGLALIALQLLCRWVTPASENVNIAFTVYKGWERWFPSYFWYWLMLTIVFALVFALSEYGLRWLFGPNQSSGVPEANS
jgi:hypothetical protein